MPFPPERLDPKLCLFEFVYFARPDTRLYGQSVHHARVRMGELLAEQAPVEADMVMGVPESGIPAAEGFARASGIPYGQGLVKNRYIGRTFIAPSQEMRAQGVRMKLNPLRENIGGQAAGGGRRLDRAGHHARSSWSRCCARAAPPRSTCGSRRRPIKWPCFYGMDTGTPLELLAANLTVDEIRDYLNVDSLAYLTLDRLIASTGASGAGFCDACFTGDYPVEVPVSLTKGVLDGERPPRQHRRGRAGRAARARPLRRRPGPGRRRRPGSLTRIPAPPDQGPRPDG